ncbi:MAG: DNA replication/repair protein RecF [Nannocystaceae bacterium]
MDLRQLHLVDYRNFGDATIEFGPKFSILHGPNGAGKTNILEAIYLVSTLRSFRLPSLRALIAKNCRQARIEIRGVEQVTGVATTLTVGLEQHGTTTRRTTQADGKPIRKATEFYGRVPTILFTPEDLNVLRGGPAARRQLLDRALFAVQPRHIIDIRGYEKVMRSRNRLLKDARSGVRAPQFVMLVDTYERQLAAFGARVWARRVEFLNLLAPEVELAFAEIHGPTPCELAYVSRLADPGHDQREACLVSALERSRNADIARGSTTVGPHLDDFNVMLERQLAAEFASQGQTRSLVLAIKIAELRAAARLRGYKPLLLLDDVSSELDRPRTEKFFEALTREAGQCLVTTTAANYVPIGSSVERLDIRVDSGRIYGSSATGVQAYNASAPAEPFTPPVSTVS